MPLAMHHLERLIKARCKFLQDGFQNAILNDNYQHYCPPPFRRKAEGHSFWLSVRVSVHPSVLPSVRPSFRPPIEYVPCVRNSSYSFTLIPLKLYRCFYHPLKICMWFGYNPQINFSHFFCNLNLVIFRAF